MRTLLLRIYTLSNNIRETHSFYVGNTVGGLSRRIQSCKIREFHDDDEKEDKDVDKEASTTFQDLRRNVIEWRNDRGQ